MKITCREAESATSGKKIGPNWQSYGISTDSRTINPQNVFVALTGENFDGHNFVNVAAEKGAVAAIVSKKVVSTLPLLIVDDTLAALQQLAQYKRNNTTNKMIGVTGSVGKTTTKEMIYSALSSYGQCYCNIGNLNNHIGLPLSLLNAPDEAEYIVLEMGMNHAGEIQLLTQIMQPDIAIITNVGPVHLEFFNSIEEIATAKAEIFIGTKGKVILNKDNKYYNYLKQKVMDFPNIERIISASAKHNADVCISSYDAKSISASIYNKYHIKYNFPTHYQHLMINSLLALAVIVALGLDPNITTHTLGDFKLNHGRGNLLRTNRFTIIDDTYNANPPSIEAALAFLAQQTGRKIAVLGDMFELGKDSAEYHRNLVNSINNHNIDLVFTVGNQMQHLYNSLPDNKKGAHYNDSTAVDLPTYLQKDDNILVKGSRGMKMELIIQKLQSYEQ